MQSFFEVPEKNSFCLVALNNPLLCCFERIIQCSFGISIFLLPLFHSCIHSHITKVNVSWIIFRWYWQWHNGFACSYSFFLLYLWGFEQFHEILRVGWRIYWRIIRKPIIVRALANFQSNSKRKILFYFSTPVESVKIDFDFKESFKSNKNQKKFPSLITDLVINLKKLQKQLSFWS